MELQRSSGFYEDADGNTRQTGYAKTRITSEGADVTLDLGDQVYVIHARLDQILPLIESFEFSAGVLHAAVPQRHTPLVRAFRALGDELAHRDGPGAGNGDRARAVSELAAKFGELDYSEAARRAPGFREALGVAAEDLVKVLIRITYENGINLGQLLEKELK